MITTAVLSILGLLLVVVIVMMMRKPAARRVGAGQRESVHAPPEIEQAQPGDVISIPGAAEDFSDLDFTVDRRSAYQLGSRRWTDLSGEFRGRRVYLEVQPGRQAEMMGLLDARKLTMADLGISEQQLADMDAKQNQSQSIEFDGKRWQYQSSRELTYFEDEQSAGEGVYRWLFEEQNGRRLLCVEKWEGEPFDVRLAQRLNPQDVSIFRAA